MRENLRNDIVYCKSLISGLKEEYNKTRTTDTAKAKNIKVSIERYIRVLEKLKTRYQQLGA